MKLDLIKSLDYQDRQQLRLSLFNAAENWDEFCARIRPVAEMMQLFAAQTEISSEMDAALKTLWLHAARFAPIGTFLRLMNDMRRIEPALYL
jgi:Trp operon repressor